MSLLDSIINHFSDSIQTHQDAMNHLSEVIEYAAQSLATALLTDKKILCCGHGRSALCAQLFSSAMLNPFAQNRPALPVFPLSIAMATDETFAEEYAKQIRALGENGDVLLLYSHDGLTDSLNYAINAAHDKQLTVIALSGRRGIAINPVLIETDIEISVPSQSAARIQEIQVLITHCLCDLIEQQLFGA